MDSPPLPSDVKSQMAGGMENANPFAAAGDLAKGQAAPAPAPGPMSGAKEKFDAIKKAIEQVSSGMTAGKSWASRAIQMLDRALEEEAKSGSASANPQPGAPTGGAAGSGGPPSAFPG